MNEQRVAHPIGERAPQMPSWADPDVEHCLERLTPGPPEQPAGARPRHGEAPDPQAWLFAERARYLDTGRCDPWAEHLLRRAGLLPPG